MDGEDLPRLSVSELVVKNFKAAYRPEKIKLGPFNIIIGRNGSGKSTCLEALQWLDTTLRLDVLKASERYHGIADLINHKARKEALLPNRGQVEGRSEPLGGVRHRDL